MLRLSPGVIAKLTPLTHLHPSPLHIFSIRHRLLLPPAHFQISMTCLTQGTPLKTGAAVRCLAAQMEGSITQAPLQKVHLLA